MKRTAVVAGATGLVGGHLLEMLCACDEYSSVVAVGRRAGARSHDKLSWQLADFEALPALPPGDYFCALGTTLKRAGSREAFRRVDQSFIVNFAEAAVKARAPHFLLVSAAGADKGSLVFYNRVKGETEALVERLPLPGLTMFRPSLLLGQRDERRAGERFGAVALTALGPLFVGPLARYRAIAAEVVARAMLKTALSSTSESFRRVLESEEIAALGGVDSV